MSLAFESSNRRDATLNDPETCWLPYTANRASKTDPRMIAGAKDMDYFISDGKKIMDDAAGS